MAGPAWRAWPLTGLALAALGLAALGRRRLGARSPEDRALLASGGVLLAGLLYFGIAELSLRGRRRPRAPQSPALDDKKAKAAT